MPISQNDPFGVWFLSSSKTVLSVLL